MRHSCWLRSPKKEEQQLVPENYQNIGSLDEIKGFLGINNNFEAKVEEEDQIVVSNNDEEHDEYFGWDFFSSNWESEELLIPKFEAIKDESFNNSSTTTTNDDNNSNNNMVKSEDFGNYYGFWDENNAVEDTKASLNLNLNYEEVLEAWSNRSSYNHHLQHSSQSISSNHYMGEVPNLDDERMKRETRVLRYKEKRQNRLYSKKIRYEVRKLNADKRPRLKGRFVKRVSE